MIHHSSAESDAERYNKYTYKPDENGTWYYSICLKSLFRLFNNEDKNFISIIYSFSCNLEFPRRIQF